MSFVEIVGPKKVFDSVLDTLQQMGVVHIEEIPIAGQSKTLFLRKIHLSEEQTRQSQTYQELAKLLAEDGIAHIPKPLVSRLRNSEEFGAQYQQWSTCDDLDVVTTARKVHAQVRSFMRRRRNLDDDVRVLAVYEELAEALTPLVKSSELPKEYEFVGVIFERKSLSTKTPLKEHIHKLTSGQCRFFQTQLKGGRAAALVGFHKQYARESRQFIAEAGLSEIHGPRQLRDKPFEEALVRVQEDLAALRTEQRQLSGQMQEFFATKASLLLALEAVCDDRLSRLNAISKFAQTDHAFIIQGWVPTARLEILSARIRSISRSPIVIHPLHSRETVNTPPVRLSNTSPVRPFEQLLALFPLPRYGTIDPTSFVAAFFPPMFGLMLADIGYGLILASGGLFLRFRRHSGNLARALGTVLTWCAFYTIIFGFVFGEFFGTFGHLLGLKPLWRERLALEGPDKTGALLGYLVLAVAVGIAHTLCGLVLGIFNARRTGEKGKAIECLARIVGLIGLFFIVARLARLLPPAFSTVGFGALLAFFVLMVVSMINHPMHGMILPLELLSTVGNVLSYARIMAIGMASAVLAMLANQFGGAIGNVVLAALVVILFHTLNLVLGIVDPTIQGLRLHYVEFFSKFYSAGGRAYSPFRTKGEMLWNLSNRQK
jgi:V/A-type H+-transporting ATPase subunit I